MPPFNSRVALVSRNYIGFELNGGIRSLRSRLCTERYSDARYLNAEFSHTLGSGWVRVAQLGTVRTHPLTAMWY